ncbi:uncharacterized protein EI97DRAFT_41022 [Westerdykella ornata]|uniref:Uncharacterized protein n=1 Tax=Westerdykella ornata TaxID=318751 RepID=A0A6A6JLE3_WESOR|nr:uncharacterized protein EI97DRAFT_41022 [Westerdykella ornata]KAF2276476.1 hypothetical protein EI97DRAFT_41022 [Westerdykella ornata]
MCDVLATRRGRPVGLVVGAPLAKGSAFHCWSVRELRSDAQGATRASLFNIQACVLHTSTCSTTGRCVGVVLYGVAPPSFAEGLHGSAEVRMRYLRKGSCIFNSTVWRTDHNPPRAHLKQRILRHTWYTPSGTTQHHYCHHRCHQTTKEIDPVGYLTMLASSASINKHGRGFLGGVIHSEPKPRIFHDTC